MIDRLREVQDVITELRNQLNSEEQQRQRVEQRSVVSLSRTCTLRFYRATHKAKFHYAILIADGSEAGRRPTASWNLAYHLARWQRPSTS